MKRYYLVVVALCGIAASAEPPTANVEVANTVDVNVVGVPGPVFDSGSHVVLRSTVDETTSCDRDRAYHRIGLDGSIDMDEFVVPAGHTLLITDVSFGVDYGSSAAFPLGSGAQYTLASRDVSGATSAVIYRSAMTLVTADNQNTRFNVSETLNAGTPVGEGRIVCAVAHATRQNGASFRTVTASILRGLLLPNG